MGEFKEIKIGDMKFNPFSMISKEWMLLTAGNAEKCNTMT
ncbi:MAG TPA: flavin reductase, partial [Ruminococcaceae bacterium]|nr:flavin reductase [Oscillospiraceae bacterium]